ncbi:MAG: LptF/LptG family permease [Deltaproteobacteria bacterium]|nr:LptF/LptG family permease [Deltaproteobacteria bacterium]
MILDRMLLVCCARAVAACLGALLALVLALDFLESAGRLLASQADAAELALYYAYRLPGLAHLLLPVSMLAGCCVAFSSLGRRHELRALAAAGIGPARLLRPVAALGLLGAGLLLLLSECLVPPATDGMERLMKTRLGRIDSSWRFFRTHLWFQGEGGRLFRVGRRSEDGRRLSSAMVLDLDAGFRVSRRQDMSDVRHGRDGWRAAVAETRVFDRGALCGHRLQRDAQLDWQVGPERFRDLSGRPAQKSLFDLGATADALRSRGLRADEYLLEMHLRFAYPLAGLVLLVLVLPFLISPSSRRTAAGAILLAAGLCFAAYFLIAVGRSAVAGGALHPAVGAWLPVAVLGLAAALAWTWRALRWRARR